MARRLAFQQHSFQLFEFSARCQQGRFLLTPSSEKNRRIIGVLARSKELLGDKLRIYFGGGTSNHVHVLMAADTVETRARFKRHFKGNVSVELRDLLPSWQDGLWGKRSVDIAVADDALEQRVGYLGAHGVKEKLVSTPKCWPGVQFVTAVTEGKPLKGVWYDRTKLAALKRKWERQPRDTRGPKPNLNTVARQMELHLDRLPQLAELSEEDHRDWWRKAIEDGVKAHPPKTSGRPKGAEAVMRQNPEGRPRKSKNSYAPWIHTTSAQRRRNYRLDYREFAETYRACQERLEPMVDEVDFPYQSCRPGGVLSWRSTA